MDIIAWRSLRHGSANAMKTYYDSRCTSFRWPKLVFSSRTASNTRQRISSSRVSRRYSQLVRTIWRRLLHGLFPTGEITTGSIRRFWSSRLQNVHLVTAAVIAVEIPVPTVERLWAIGIKQFDIIARVPIARAPFANASNV